MADRLSRSLAEALIAADLLNEPAVVRSMGLGHGTDLSSLTLPSCFVGPILLNLAPNALGQVPDLLSNKDDALGDACGITLGKEANSLADITGALHDRITICLSHRR